MTQNTCIMLPQATKRPMLNPKKSFTMMKAKWSVRVFPRSSIFVYWWKTLNSSVSLQFGLCKSQSDTINIADKIERGKDSMHHFVRGFKSILLMCELHTTNAPILNVHNSMNLKMN